MRGFARFDGDGIKPGSKGKPSTFPSVLYFFEYPLPSVGPIPPWYGYWSLDPAGVDDCSIMTGEIKLATGYTRSEAKLVVEGYSNMVFSQEYGYIYKFLLLSWYDANPVDAFSSSVGKRPSVVRR